jgi:hypothetical protein
MKTYGLLLGSLLSSKINEVCQKLEVVHYGADEHDNVPDVQEEAVRRYTNKNGEPYV